jgi:excisionase family DNA binding protein
VALTVLSEEEDRWLSPLEAANDLGITRKVVYRMIHRRELRARELQAEATGGLWRIRQRVLQTHMLRQEQQARAHPGERRTSRGIGRRRTLPGCPPLPDNEVLCAREDEGHDHG